MPGGLILPIAFEIYIRLTGCGLYCFSSALQVIGYYPLRFHHITFYPRHLRLLLSSCSAFGAPPAILADRCSVAISVQLDNTLTGTLFPFFPVPSSCGLPC